MRSSFTLALIAALAVGSFGLRAEEGQAPAADKPKPERMAGERTRGVVASVDAATKTITVTVVAANGAGAAATAATPGAETKSFTLVEATKIKVDGKDATIAEITVGAKVMVITDQGAVKGVMIGEYRRRDKPAAAPKP
jgi:hypothetical protein